MHVRSSKVDKGNLLDKHVTHHTTVIWQKAQSLRQVYPTPCFYSPGGSIGLTV